jgi:proton-translocating NAD(P)+ transhydrogenase subunit alpha
MRIGVPRETAADERRVALVPESVSRLRKAGVEVRVERGAGVAAFYPDESYAAVGAELADGPSPIYGDCDVVVKVQRPSVAECAQLREGVLVISLLPVATSADTLAALTSCRRRPLSPGTRRSSSARRTCRSCCRCS